MAEYTVDGELDLLTTALSGGPHGTNRTGIYPRALASMVKGLARRFSTGAESHNDLEQEGYLALFEALHRFDQGRGVRLGTFIYQSVLSRMLHWRRSQRRTLSQLNAESGGRLQSLDADIAAGDEEMPT